MKKKVLVVSAVVVIVAIIILLIFKPFKKKDAEATFETVKVERGNITNIVTATGTIEAVKSVNVGTQVSGIINKVYVDFKALMNQLEQSQASVNQAQAQLNFQEATFNRMKALFEKRLIAQSDYDQALYNYENAKASLTNANAAYDRNKVNLDYATIYSPIDGVVLNRAIEEGQTVAASFNTPTLFTIVNDLTQMEVQASVDEADIGKVKLGQRVEFTVDAYIDLMFEGTVSEVRIQPITTNNVVTYVVILNAPNPDKKLMPGMTASATVFVDEKENTLMLSGKALRFTPSQAYMQKMFAKMAANGKNRGIPSGGSYPRPGGPASASGSSDLPSGMPMPGAGFGKDGGKVVWVKNDQGGIRPNPIKTGIDNGTNIEVVSGLKEGDEVIISMSGDGSTTTKKTTEGPRGPFPF
jgi:HlyD family secretion protein